MPRAIARICGTLSPKPFSTLIPKRRIPSRVSGLPCARISARMLCKLRPGRSDIRCRLCRRDGKADMSHAMFHDVDGETDHRGLQSLAANFPDGAKVSGAERANESVISVKGLVDDLAQLRSTFIAG